MRGERMGPSGVPPTMEDLEQAGTRWEPVDGDDEDGLEIARHDGFVILRHPTVPYRPVLVIAEDAWDTGAWDADDDLTDTYATTEDEAG